MAGFTEKARQWKTFFYREIENSIIYRKSQATQKESKENQAHNNQSILLKNSKILSLEEWQAAIPKNEKSHGMVTK